MANWLSKYEQGGLVLKKKTKDNYGKKANPNNVQVSVGPDFVGLGYNIKGRNYSPAWGGQFQNGGFLQPISYKLPSRYRIPYAEPSSELATSIGGGPGEPAYLIPTFKYGKPLQDPEAEYRKTGEHLGGPFKTYQEAEKWEQEIRHPYVEKGKPIPTPLKRWGDMAMGGGIPGAVGFTYARTINPAPSNGKYAKKTKASAQNGKEMKFYQEGLDFTPKTISKNGSVIKDDMGQWAHPGEITEIGSNEITMQGVDYPVLGISDTGDTQMMYPDQYYKFDGEKVIEYPMMQNGGGLSRFDLETMTALEKDIKNQKARNTQETISQYTPKLGDQQRMNAAKDAYRKEQAKLLNRAASSEVATKAMENIVEPMLAIDMAMGVGKLAKPALKAAGKYLTEETALKNTYKLNPYIYKPVPGSKNLAINNILENPIDEYRNLDVFLAAKDTQKQVENEMIRRSGIENKALGEIEGSNLGVRRSSPTSKYKFSNEPYNPFSDYGYGLYDEQALKQSYSDSFDDYVRWKQNMLKKLPKNKNGGWLNKYK